MPLATARTFAFRSGGGAPDSPGAPDPDPTQQLLDYAQSGSAVQLRDFVRGWKRMEREGEISAEEMRHQSRKLSVVIDGEGMPRRWPRRARRDARSSTESGCAQRPHGAWRATRRWCAWCTGGTGQC